MYQWGRRLWEEWCRGMQFGCLWARQGGGGVLRGWRSVYWFQLLWESDNAMQRVLNTHEVRGGWLTLFHNVL